MLTVSHPEILRELLPYLPVGLLPTRIQGRPLPLLILKCTKEMILTAKLRSGFRFYLAPVDLDGLQTHGLITAFFDDHDQPLTLRTPLFDEDTLGQAFFGILASDRFDAHFFDEQNRELLGYRVRNKGAARFRSMFRRMRFPPPDPRLTPLFHNSLPDWFGQRDAREDKNALSVSFEEELFPEPVYREPEEDQESSYHGRREAARASLQLPDDGVSPRELDIVGVLHRLFPSESIFLNPTRSDTGTEFVDVMVAGMNHVLLIQSKDSPNTEAVLQRSIGRKKAVALSQLERAARQLEGSISYALGSDPVSVVVAGRHHQVPVEHREVIGLIVVRELFDDEFSSYSPVLLDLFGRTGIRCFALDYPELHEYTFFLRTEKSFIGALDEVFDVAQERRLFPRLRLGLPTPNEDS